MLDIIKDTFKSWINNDPVTHSAAAAYFAVFSLPGLMIIIMSITTFFLDEALVRAEIRNYVGGFIGPDAAVGIQSIIDNARLSNNGLSTLIIGGGVLVFGATGFFIQLKNSFNSIWHVKPKPEKTILRLFVNRVVSLSVAIMLGILILLSMYVSAGLKIFGNWLVSTFPDLNAIPMLEMGLSFLTLSLLFALIFKVLPDVKIKVRYALSGGILSSFLFMLGELGFAHALSISTPQSAFGAAGSVVLLMIWVTYGCMILQLGAAFIKALINHHEGEVRTTRFVMKE